MEKSAYLLLLLSDSNLPTGGFVASSGLESFSAHGFLNELAHIHAQAQADVGLNTSSSPSFGNQKQSLLVTPSITGTHRPKPPSQTQLASATLSYISNLISSYARSSLSFLSDSYALVNEHCKSGVKEEEPALERCRFEGLLKDLKKLDSVYHTLTLNHVARRASTTQGIALLTLYSKAFSAPLNFGTGLDGVWGSSRSISGEAVDEDDRRKKLGKIIDEVKKRIRCGDMKGNLPISWGIFSAALGLTLVESTHLHLFLTARSLLSSSVRLNTLGPYISQQLTLFDLPAIIDEALLKAGALRSSSLSSEPRSPEGSFPHGWRCRTGLVLVNVPAHSSAFEADPSSASTLTSGVSRDGDQQKRKQSFVTEKVNDEDCNSQGFAWDWEDEGAWGDEIDFDGNESERDGAEGVKITPPAQTWPLGELVQGRHDQLHSRLFNS